MPVSPPRLSTIVEGVGATIALFGVPVRVVITAEATQARFGGPCDPASWLATYEANSEVIAHAAKRAYKAGKKTLVLQAL